MGEHHESHGPLKLYVDDEVVAEAEIRTMTGHFSLCGEGLCIGYDGGDAGQQRVQARVRVHRRRRSCKVVFDVADDAYVDVERAPRGGDGARLMTDLTPEQLEQEVARLSTPDVLDTPFGRIELFDGVPKPDSVATIYDALDLDARDRRVPQLPARRVARRDAARPALRRDRRART